MVPALPADVWLLISEELHYRDWISLRSASRAFRLVLTFHAARYTPVMIVRVAPAQVPCQCRLFYDRVSSMYVRLGATAPCEEHSEHAIITEGRTRELLSTLV